jgi:hypothetical protein
MVWIALKVMDAAWRQQATRKKIILARQASGANHELNPARQGIYCARQDIIVNRQLESQVAVDDWLSNVRSAIFAQRALQQETRAFKTRWSHS